MSRKRTPKSKIPTLRPPVFNLGDKNWKEYLDTEGYVVLNNIITKKNCETATAMFKQEISEVSPNFDWENKETWVINNSPMVWCKSSVVFNGFGQSDSNWFLRLNSRTKDAFAKAYGTDQLATSFDGFSLFISDTQKSVSWLHQDQRSEDQRYSIQGILNLLPCDELDAGFICVPKSHINYTQPVTDTDWVMLPKDDPNEKLAVKLLTPARSLILFHSKTIHANTGIVKNHPNGLHINRLSAYITFVPKDRQTPEIIEQRKAAYLTGVATSHYADRFEPKTIPGRIRANYAARNFNDLKPKLEKGNIPDDRLELI